MIYNPSGGGSGTSLNTPNSPTSTTAPVAIGNLATGGNIGIAAATVDVNSAFVLTQTTAGQSATLPNPTNLVGARTVTLKNSLTSTTSIIMYGKNILAGESTDFFWDGSNWSIIDNGVDVLSEYGENVTITHNSTTASIAYVDLPGGSFTLPSAGVWEVEYNLYSQNSLSPGFNYFKITNSLNVDVPNSAGIWAGPAGNVACTTNVVRITTTGPTVYKIRWAINSGTATINNNTQNNSKITWKKISGQAPVNGLSVDSLFVKRITTNQQVTVANTDVIFNDSALGNIPYNNATGVATLDASKEYEIETQIKGRFLNAAGAQIAMSGTVNQSVAVFNVPIANDSSTNAIDVTGAAFVAPVTGIILVTMYARSSNTLATAGTASVNIGLYSSANALQANSEMVIGRDQNLTGASTSSQNSGTIQYRLNAVAGTTYKMRAWSDGANISSTLQNNGNGRTGITWQVVHAPMFLTYQLVDGANVQLPNSNEGVVMVSGISLSENSINATAIIPPNVGGTVKVRVLGLTLAGANRFEIESNRSYLKIKQLGASAFTSLNTMVGATAIVAGKTGGVPAPAAGDQAKVLLGDGTWGSVGSSDVVQNISATGNITAYSSIVLANAAAGNITLTLPTSAGNIGKTLKVVKTDTSNNIVTVNAFGGQTLNASQNTLTGQNASLTFEADTVTTARTVALIGGTNSFAPVTSGQTFMVPASIAPGANSGTAITAITFTIPSAGTWFVTPSIHCRSASANDSVSFGLYDAGVLVTNTETSGILTNSSPGTIEATGSTMWVVVTTGSKVFDIRAWSPNSTIGGSLVLNSATGRSKVTWVQAPTTPVPTPGTTYGEVYQSAASVAMTTTTSTSATNFFPVWTFPAAGTYRVTASIHARCSGNQSLSYALYQLATTSPEANTEASVLSLPAGVSTYDTTGTTTWIVTALAGALDYRIRGWSPSGSFGSALSDNTFGRSKVVWERIQ